ncbi:afamin [Echinops telfairi]|uniref:Afamin n=1 Tax=Echinops telfairi TaxID=9371 RepID=A0AC55CL09_ECHTE|nr:afamin [Echinops telfairi]
MEWFKLAGFVICLLFLSESLTLPTNPQDADHLKTTQTFIQDNTEYITIVAFAQYVQEATFEEVEMFAKEMMALKDKCVADMALPECSGLPNDILQKSICAVEGLPQKYNFSHCCAKSDLERRGCFYLNKKADVGFLPPLPMADAEKKCQEYKQKKDLFLKKYLYEVARRNPFVFVTTLLSVATRFEDVAKTCCEEEDKASCFQTKASPVIKYLKENSAFEKTLCGASMRFGPRIITLINAAIIGQKFPKIEFKTLTSTVKHISSTDGGCCEGDAVGCIHTRSMAVNHICTNQDSISTKVKECCDKPILERGDCIVNLGRDEKPSDLSPREAKFTDSKDVCQHRDADQENFMIEFLYEYSRRHQDLSTPEILRIGEVYENLLDDCCKKENPSDCYSHAEEKFNETTEKSLKMVQHSCEQAQKLGKDGFKHECLIRFTRMAPQLSTEELTSLSQDTVKAFSVCCAQEEQFSCLDNSVDLVLGELCGVNQKRSINPAVENCCQSSFAFRRHCFYDLKSDEIYLPQSASQGLFTFHPDLCQATNEERQRRQERFLVDLVKLKPQHADVKLLSLFADFTHLVEQCCQAEGPEACFNEEGPKLEAKAQ